MKFSTSFISATTEFSTFSKQIPAPCFRREIELAKLDSAELTICGLGFYELYVNGNRITRGLLSPYISNPDDLLCYDNYDLMPYLVEDKNVIGVILGNGMQNCYGGDIWDFQTARWRSAPKLALCFEGKSADGAIEFDATSGFVCTESPIYLDDIRIGEFYDATKELGDWLMPGYDTSAWRAPLAAETPRGECRLTDVDPILPTMELTPISIKPGKVALSPNYRLSLPVHEIPADEDGEGFIYDFGVNAAGLCRLHIKNAKPGQKIVLQFGETLAKDEQGRDGLDMRGMNFLPARYNHRDIYICKGGDETYMPSFTYHGFRYVLVIGITPEQAIPELLTYVVMNTSMSTRSTFSCSDEITNKLWDATIVSDLANFYHFPTDCPHREKNGWTGDAQLSAEQMVMALSPERNWREWLCHIRKSMNEQGAIPGIVPTSGWGFAWGNGPAWDTIMVQLPYFAWLYRGDLSIARDMSTALVRYINYISTRLDDKGLIHIGLGDWCSSSRCGTVAPLEFTDTVVCIDFCRKAAKLFELLGKKAQQSFAEQIGADLLACARKYLIDKASATALGRCQTTQAMAIFYDIFEDADKQKAFDKLVAMIERNNEHFDSGILGLRVIFHVLSAYGRTDLAFKMITRTDDPNSYGYQIAQGSTSIWEHFHRIEETPASFNHHFFGDIISWFMKNLVGININPYERSAKEIRLAPRFIDALDHAEGTHETVCGKLTASWVRDGGTIVYKYSIPAGISAEFVLEEGWFRNDGRTHFAVSGEGEIRIIRECETCLR